MLVCQSAVLEFEPMGKKSSTLNIDEVPQIDRLALGLPVKPPSPSTFERHISSRLQDWMGRGAWLPRGHLPSSSRRQSLRERAAYPLLCFSALTSPRAES